MTDKVTLGSVGDGSVINAFTVAGVVNSNNAIITTALDNTLSRDGTAPNQMLSILDMNNNQIVNLPAPVSLSSPARLADVNALVTGGTINTLPTGGTSTQVLAKNSSTNYDVSWQNATPQYVPVGGTPGQVLTKNSGVNYDLVWTTPSSVNSIVAPPGGRLTLASGIPVMNSSVTAATTIYYAPYVSPYVPLNVGGNLGLYQFTANSSDAVGLSVVLGSNWAANSNYDWFVYNNGGSIVLGSGPDWSAGAVAGSNTIGASTRGTGAGSTALSLFNGVLTNTNAMTLRTGNAATLATAAHTCTYIGTTRTGSAGQISFTYGFGASGGGTANLYVWNSYNQVLTSTSMYDNTSSWTYSSATVRASNNSASNRINFITGLAQTGLNASFNQLLRTAGGTGVYGQIGIGLNSTTAFDRAARQMNNSAGVQDITVGVQNAYSPVLGANYVSSLENGDGVNSTTFFGNPGNVFMSLSASLLM